MSPFREYGWCGGPQAARPRGNVIPPPAAIRGLLLGGQLLGGKPGGLSSLSGGHRLRDPLGGEGVCGFLLRHHALPTSRSTGADPVS